MEDQGKRLLLAVGIIAVLFVAWTWLFPPKRPPQQAPQQAQPTAPAAAPGAPAAAAAPGAPPTAATPTDAPVATCTPETEGAPVWDTPDYTATFSHCGGAVATFVLKGEQYRQTVGTNPVQMDLVRAEGKPAYYAMQASVAATAPGVASPDAPRAPVVSSGAEWTLVKASNDEVTYRFTSADGLVVTKHFHRLAARYVFGLDVEVSNASPKKRIVETSFETFGYQDPDVREPSMFHYAPPTWGTACFVGDKYHRDLVKDLKKESRLNTGEVRWTGADHQYFLFGFGSLDDNAAEASSCARGFVPGAYGILRAAMTRGLPSTLEPNGLVSYKLVAYAGPKLLDQLEAVSKVVGKETHFREAVDLGWLAILCRPMLFLLKLFHGWIGSWGIAIILLTVVVKLLTLYWTTKSMRSMKAMSKLKPEMDRIREKYPDDKQRQNLEMMNLYKTHQISPFGGCLPLLLQMPIWFALYRTLASSADLYHTPFIGYIKDLTAPDPYYVLPVLLTGLMFFQMRLSPTTVDSQQQKIMQWMMPVMMGVFSLLFPSGLALYMLTNTMLGMIHQLYLNRTDPSSKPAPAAAVTAAAPAPAPAAARPQGRKGKNRAKA